MYILIDIGGTKTRIALSKNLEVFESTTIFSTPQKFEEGVKAITSAVRKVCNEKISAVMVGIAASPNKEKTKLVGGGPNIADWLEKPIKEKLEEVFNTLVYIENDTAIGGLAQVIYGPAKGYEIATYITISTGVGGCRFVGGKIDKSAMGFEPGWQIVMHTGTDKDNVNTTNSCVLGYCSGGYLMSHIGGVCVEKKEGKKPYEITDNNFWDKKAKILAYGLHNVCTMWSPDIIVLGGSMMKEIGIPIESTEKYLHKTLKDVFPVAPKIVSAEFGDEMGFWGAMAYLKQKLSLS